jgi:hypothetical protein
MMDLNTEKKKRPVLWRCVEKNCKSRCKIDIDIQMILGGNFNQQGATEV